MTTAFRSTGIREEEGRSHPRIDPTVSAKVWLIAAGLAELVWLLALVWMALRAVPT
jgi:hypothetical protein